MSFKSCNFEDFETFEQAEVAVSACLRNLPNTSPSIIIDTLVSFLKRQLIRGIHIRKEILSGSTSFPKASVLTSCVRDFGILNVESELEPSCADYCLHFVLGITNALSSKKDCLLNKSEDYMKIYYAIVSLVLNINESGLTSFKDLEDYQMKWFEQEKPTTQQEYIKIHIEMKAGDYE